MLVVIERSRFDSEKVLWLPGLLEHWSVTTADDPPPQETPLSNELIGVPCSCLVQSQLCQSTRLCQAD